MGDSVDADAERRREYIELRTNLDSIAQKAAKSFDKTILTLAAGALVLSITFIKEIAPEPKAMTSIILYIGWLGFVFSILSTLASFHETTMAIRSRMHELDKRHYPSIEIQAPRRPWSFIDKPFKFSADDPWGDLIDLLNRFSTWSFIVGAVMTLLFCACNIKWK